MRLLITRPLHQAAATVFALEEDGHECVVSPVLVRQQLDLPQPSDSFEIIVLTSRNAVDGLARQWPAKGREDWPVFTVGQATCDAATAAGFRGAIACGGTAPELVEEVATICQERPNPEVIGKPGILYPCALQPAHDLPAMFERYDLKCAAWPVYAMDDAQEFTAEAVRGLREATLDGVLLYSARSARAFAALVSQLDGPGGIPPLFALSQAVRSALPSEMAATCKVTKVPTETAMRLLLSQYKK